MFATNFAAILKESGWRDNGDEMKTEIEYCKIYEPKVV